MKNNNQNLNWPENTPDIITNLTEKYKIKENTTELFSKIGSNTATNGREILALIARMQNKKLAPKNLENELQILFRLKKVKAQALARDIKNKFSVGKQAGARVKMNNNKRQPAIKQNQNATRKKAGIPDSYREPIK